MRNLLEGGPLPPKLDELRRPLIAAIHELADDLAKAPPIDETAKDLLRSDGSQAMAIMGERGSGKSSLLAGASGALHQEGRHLVMPIMSPELFAETDSVITTFLAELWEQLKPQPEPQADAEAAPPAIGTERAMKLLASAARGFAIARTTTAALEHGTDSPSDFAEDFLTVSRSGVRLVSKLRALTQELCFQPPHPDGPRLIIVPIDDPDLAPGSIVNMLTDIQILGSVPGIVPLTCFSPGDLNEAWIAARSKLSPSIGEERLHFLLARQLEKVFPYRCRFEIEPIPPSERTQFVPIGEKGDLREKLEALRAKAEAISHTTWPIDTALCSDGQRRNVSNPLPDNARSLVQLWEALDALGTAPDEANPEMLHLTLRRILHIISERLAARLGKTTSQLVYIGPPTDDTVRRTLTPDLAGSKLLITASGDLGMDDEQSIAQFALRPLYRIRVKIAESGSDKNAQELDAAGVSAVLVIQEIAFGSGFYDVTTDPIFLGPDEWRFLQGVWLANQATDNTFLLLPHATTLSEVLRAATLWNQLVELCRDCPTEAVLATCVRAACLTVEPDAELELETSYSDAFEQACETYIRCRGEVGNTSDAFVGWFEQSLPFQWHSALFSREDIRGFAKTHQELRSKPVENENRERSPVTVFFDVRLGVILDALEAADESDIGRHSWPAGYFDLASAFGSEHLSRLGRLYPRWQRDSTGVHAGAATVGAVAKVHSKAVLAPYETPEGTQMVASGVAALRQARARARTRLRMS